MADQNELATRCTEVATLSRDALDWVQDPENADTVGPEHKSLVHLLRRASRRAEKLGRAARTKMSVSVFGPSQAGKSFLVSVLARPGEGRLVADFPGPGGQLDYISEINPEGEGESTGLVTRFTMTKEPMPEGFPIQLNLLSEADVARTIINSFYMDGDQSEPAPDAAGLNAHIEAFKPKAGAADVPGMSFEEVLEIQDYIQSTFGRAAYAAALKPFWEDAAALAPRMSIRDRAAFLEILWGGHGALSDLYVTLAEGLARIGHPEVVHVPLDALIPRETSIIDVKALGGLFGGDAADTLKVRAPSGTVTDLPRAVVCALAAELVFPMLEEPSPLFAETDLLDFPGARNRFEQPLSKTLEKPETTVSQLLLRGKVAYLFDRYVENQEITSMLLCVPDSNMETLDLPGLVDNWIALTHGNQPKARRDVDCILFFVLTKFDKHLGESAAGGGDSTRFERRMQASLLEKFGRSKDGWVDAWTPGQPFQNCYWLRNPNFFVEGLLDYDDKQRETGIRPEKQARLAELRAGCLASEAVQRHFKDPGAAWDAALSLNDGGVSYLLRELTEVCVPDSKLRQLSGQIEKLAGDLASALGPFHVSDDVEKRIEEKRVSAAHVIDCLEDTLEGHRFGALLDALCVDQDAIEDRISRVPSSVRISSAVSSRPETETQTAPARPGRARPARPGRPAGASAPAAADTADEASHASNTRIRTMSAEAFQAGTAVDIWIEALGELRQDIALLQAFSLSQTAAGDLTSEMIHGLRRMRVMEDMHERLRAIDYGMTVDKQAPPAAIVCAECINGFVFTLGADRLPDGERPVVELGDGGQRPVFAPRPEVDTAMTLPAEPRPTAEETWSDWVYALDVLFTGNARDTGTGEINIEQNLKLGRVLRGLEGDGDA
jgi:hypothetical protein